MGNQITSVVKNFDQKPVPVILRVRSSFLAVDWYGIFHPKSANNINQLQLLFLRQKLHPPHLRLRWLLSLSTTTTTTTVAFNMKRPLSLSLLRKCFLLLFLLLPLAIDASIEEDERRQRTKRPSRSRPSSRPSEPHKGKTPDSERDPTDLDLDVHINAYIMRLQENRYKPRDIIEGSASAIQTLIVGGMASLVSFIGAPLALIALAVSSTAANNEIAGESGGFVLPAIAGMIGGGLIGSISTFTISFYSLFRAVTYLWDGLLETPRTLKAWIIEGQMWNPYERKWKDKKRSLEDERQEILSLIEEQEAETARKRKEMEVADTKLYDLLGVPTDASNSIIKKAYFSKAKDIHPDKNKGDPKAHDQFVQLNEAYSILSDDAKRSKYDRWGSLAEGSGGDGRGTIGVNSVLSMTFDANLFVAILFSGESGMSSPTVENFVGELGLATFIDRGYKKISLLVEGAEIVNQNQHNEDQIGDRILRIAEELFEDETNKNEIRRTWRLIEIATHLVSKSRLLCNHSNNARCPGLESEETFRIVIRNDANQILKDSGFYGPTYLEIIGSSLMSVASRNVVPHGVKTSFQKWTRRKEFIEALYDLYNKLGPISDENHTMDDFATVCLPEALRLINIYNQMDISLAIKEAIWRVLHDPGASRVERRNRKRAIRIIGEEFTKLAAVYDKADKEKGDERTVNELKSNFALALRIAFKQR